MATLHCLTLVLILACPSKKWKTTRIQASQPSLWSPNSWDESTGESLFFARRLRGSSDTTWLVLQGSHSGPTSFSSHEAQCRPAQWSLTSRSLPICGDKSLGYELKGDSITKAAQPLKVRPENWQHIYYSSYFEGCLFFSSLTVMTHTG